MTRYFTADWHFDDKRLGDFNPFFRPFSSISEQNETIIKNINDVVQPDDELYHLGDVSVTPEGVALMDRIRCKRRTLIIGNYDDNKIPLLRQHFDRVVPELSMDVAGIACYLNHYPKNWVADRFNIVGHIHGLWKVKPNMVNVGVDAWHFRPVSEKEIGFVHTAIQKYYDENVFARCIGYQ